MSNGFRDYDPNPGRYIESDAIGLDAEGVLRARRILGATQM